MCVCEWRSRCALTGRGQEYARSGGFVGTLGCKVCSYGGFFWKFFGLAGFSTEEFRITWRKKKTGESVKFIWFFFFFLSE